MKLFIDDANVRMIEWLCAYYPIDGVTTNPSILARYGTKPIETLKAIRKVIGKDRLLFVQTLSSEADKIMQEARKISWEFKDNTVIKIPVVPEGLRAIEYLTKEGLEICATAVYTPMQGYLAAKAGAKYIAPYVNRIDNLGYDGIGVAKTIQEIIENNDMEAEVLAAAFRNSQQVLELCRFGIAACTASPEVITGFLKNAEVTAAVNGFAADFAQISPKDWF